MPVHFDPTSTYSTVTDIEGNIFAFQNNLYFDKFGNSWSTVPPSKSGWAGPTAPSTGGAVASVNAKTGTVVLGASDVGSISSAIGWPAATNTSPTIVSGTPLSGGFAGVNAVMNTSAGITTLGTAIDDVTTMAYGDFLLYGIGGVNTWTISRARSGFPIARATGYTFIAQDDTLTVIASGTPAYTIPTGLPAGWGIPIIGAFTLSGGLTFGSGITDDRATTGVAACSMVQTAADGSAYVCIGTK